MKILCLADIHIHNYFSYSVVDEKGLPSRLNQYKLLAHDLAAYARQNSVELIVVAGDLVQSPTCAPMVTNTAKYFLDIISREFRTFVINGNHDLDSKSGNDEYHSVIAPLVQDNNEVVYESGEGVHEYKGYTFFLRSWKPAKENFTNFQPADVFIGHGPVTGCRDLLGYEFKHGFDVKELWQNYGVSFIGDIHNPQLFEDPASKHKVVIPGQPIGQNFSSNLGSFGLYDLADGSYLSVSVRDLEHASDYHYFRNNSDVDPIEWASYPHTHYRNKLKIKKGEGDKKSTKSVKTDLLVTIKHNIDQLNVEHKEEAKKVLDDIYAVIKGSYVLPTPNPVVYVSLSVTNFLSIQDTVVFEFPRDEDEVLIRGSQNGVGKSTFAEAFYWAATGELTKSVNVSKINNDRSNKPARVEFLFSIDKDVYKIVRTREVGNLLTLFKNDSNITKGSSSATQELIYQVFGFSREEIDLMVYFSLNELNLFSSLTTNSQLEYISKLAQVEILEEMKLQFRDVIQGLTNEILTRGGALNQLESSAAVLRAKIDSVKMAKLVEESQSQIVANYVADQDKLDAARKKRNEHNQEITELDEELKSCAARQKVIDALCAADQTVYRKKEENKAAITTALAKKKKLDAGTCYACGQHVHDTTLLDAVNKEIQDLSKKAKDFAVYKSTVSEVEILDIENRVTLATTRLDAVKVELKAVNSEINKLEEQIKIATANKVDYDGQIGFLTEQLNEALVQINTFDLDKIEKKKSSYLIVAKLLEKTNKNPVYTSSIDVTYQSFLSIVNELFEPIGFVVSVSKSYELMIKVDSGKERPVNALSGGEKRLFDVVIAVALSSAYQQLYGLDKPLFNVSIWDEVFVYLSEQNLDFVHGLIGGLTGVKLIISNDISLQQLFQHWIFVTKDDKKGSQYQMNF